MSTVVEHQEQKRRIESLERALEVAMYWLLRAHAAIPPSITGSSTRGSIGEFLGNHGLGPTGKPARDLLKRPMEAYHHELEKAVKRATK